MLFVKPEAIFVIGPSGVGKDTLIDNILAEHPDLFMPSASATTRAPRKDDVRPNGRCKYTYHGQNEFEHMLRFGMLYEAKPSQDDSYYGTPKAPFHEAREQGKVVITDINYQGADEIFNHFLDRALYIYLYLPESSLEKRLCSRESAQDIPINRKYLASRLQKARTENEWALQFIGTTTQTFPLSRLVHVINADPLPELVLQHFYRSIDPYGFLDLNPEPMIHPAGLLVR